MGFGVDALSSCATTRVWSLDGAGEVVDLVCMTFPLLKQPSLSSTLLKFFSSSDVTLSETASQENPLGLEMSKLPSLPQKSEALLEDLGVIGQMSSQLLHSS